MASIFTRIIKGEIPSFKIFEDEQTIAILALDQVNPGHSLVIPKIEVDHFFEVPEPHYSAVFNVAKKIAPAIREVSQAPRVGSAIVGFEVAHFHLHLIPLFSIQDLDFRRGRRLSDAKMTEIQKSILSHLK